MVLNSRKNKDYSNQDKLKMHAAKVAIKYVKMGMKIAIGTGTTVDFFISELASIKPYIKFVAASSYKSTAYLVKNGFHVVDFYDYTRFDLYIDGADEANTNGILIKGGGGALTGEKICCVMSDIFICIIDKAKLVNQLGNFSVAVEVVPKACFYVMQELKTIGGFCSYRKNFITDNGNFIIDAFQLDLSNPYSMESRINQIVGVVCNGIFAFNRANILIVSNNLNAVNVMA